MVFSPCASDKPKRFVTEPMAQSKMMQGERIMGAKVKMAVAATLMFAALGVGNAQAGLIECTVSGFPPMLHCKVG
jgi:hypothetical protein